MTSKQTITVLGAGAMGSRLAINYAAAGHPVTVWNRTADRANTLAQNHDVTAQESLHEALSQADIVVSMLADDDAATSVWLDPMLGSLAALKPDAVWIESSTLTTTTVKKLFDAATTAGVDFLEAPVVGTLPQVESGSLFYLLGGGPELCERMQPVIDVNAGAVKRMGTPGSAAVMKLAINGLLAIQVAAYAEIVGLLDQSDLDTGESIELLAKLPITAPKIGGVLTKFAERSFEPNFPVRLVAKDLDYLGRLAEGFNAANPVGEVTADLYKQAIAAGLGELDISGIASVYLAD